MFYLLTYLLTYLTLVWGESMKNSNVVALWVVVSFNLPDEFVDNARISCLERWLRPYNFLTGNKLTDVCLISIQFSNKVYSKGFATKINVAMSHLHSLSKSLLFNCTLAATLYKYHHLWTVAVICCLQRNKLLQQKTKSNEAKQHYNSSVTFWKPLTR